MVESIKSAFFSAETCRSSDIKASSFQALWLIPVLEDNLAPAMASKVMPNESSSNRHETDFEDCTPCRLMGEGQCKKRMAEDANVEKAVQHFSL